MSDGYIIQYADKYPKTVDVMSGYPHVLEGPERTACNARGQPTIDFTRNIYYPDPQTFLSDTVKKPFETFCKSKEKVNLKDFCCDQSKPQEEIYDIMKLKYDPVRIHHTYKSGKSWWIISEILDVVKTVTDISPDHDTLDSRSFVEKHAIHPDEREIYIDEFKIKHRSAVCSYFCYPEIRADHLAYYVPSTIERTIKYVVTNKGKVFAISCVESITTNTSIGKPVGYQYGHREREVTEKVIECIFLLENYNMDISSMFYRMPRIDPTKIIDKKYDTKMRNCVVLFDLDAEVDRHKKHEEKHEEIEKELREIKREIREIKREIMESSTALDRKLEVEITKITKEIKATTTLDCDF